MSYMLSISIGPVQDFIAAARRTRDLRTGSWLLSEISKAVASALRDSGAELVFPFSPDLETDLSPASPYAVANKIVAIVEAQDEGQLRAVAGRLHAAATRRLLDIGRQAFGQSRAALLLNGLDQDRAETQLEPFIEFYAAWAPFDESTYRQCREHVEEWAAARKALRDFIPHDGRAGLPKSSLDGIRETVIRKNGLRPGQFFIRENEQLDGVGIVKRFAGPKDRFDSTIDVAAGPYVTRLSRTCPEALGRYKKYLEDHEDDIPFTYSYLFQHDSRGPEQLAEPHRSEVEQIVKEAGFPLPAPPYYAFLLGDGDSMGETISTLTGKDHHRDLSVRLSRFAKSAQELASQHDGWNLVFAGGDDLMAMLPLHEALEGALGFRECFGKAMEGLAKPPTLSAGIAVVHALEPLSEVRRLAKSAERTAKKMPGKDALAILVAARSGSPITFCDHWNTLATEIQSAIGLYSARALSPSFAYALRDLLHTSGRRDFEHLDEVLFPLACAMAEKKQAKPEFLRRLNATAQRAVADSGPRPYRAALSRLMELLLVARPFARAKREAEA